MADAAAPAALAEAVWRVRYGVSAETEERTAMIVLGRLADAAGAGQTSLIAVPAAAVLGVAVRFGLKLYLGSRFYDDKQGSTGESSAS